MASSSRYANFTDKEIIEDMINLGSSMKAEMMVHYRATCGSDEMAEEMCKLAMEHIKNARIVGNKPRPGAPNVEIHPLTKNVSIRIWPSGRTTIQRVCFDFVDNNHRPFNTPDGWAVYVISSWRWLQEPSLEEHSGMKRCAIPAGTEKYNVMHGSRIAISIPHYPIIGINIPLYGQDRSRLDGQGSIYWDVKQATST